MLCTIKPKTFLKPSKTWKS